MEKGEDTALVQVNMVESIGEELVLKRCVGECALLSDRACSAYELRPKACRDYPWYNLGGQLFYDRGCPGIMFDSDQRPDPQGIREFAWYLRGWPHIFRVLFTLALRVW